MAKFISTISGKDTTKPLGRSKALSSKNLFGLTSLADAKQADESVSGGVANAGEGEVMGSFLPYFLLFPCLVAPDRLPIVIGRPGHSNAYGYDFSYFQGAIKMGKSHGKWSKRGRSVLEVCERTTTNVADGLGVMDTLGVRHFTLLVCIWFRCISFTSFCFYL